jgi:GGDEF domain-containing protein
MEAIAIHAVQRDPVAYAAFRDSIRQHGRGIENSESSDQILVAAGQVIQAMGSYNREIETCIRMQAGELQEMVHMLSRTMLEITRESAHAGDNLARIEKELDATAGLDDLRLMKGRLRDSLQSIAKESFRQRDAAKKVNAGLHAQLRAAPADNSLIDGVTGLPNASELERAIEAAIAPGSITYVAVLCMERLSAINASFGYGVGDRLLLQFAQDVAQRLSGNDRLFRWRGPTLAALLNRPEKIHDVRIEVRHLIGQRREQVVEFQGRSVLLPVAARCTVICLQETSTIEETLDQINAFVAVAS